MNFQISGLDEGRFQHLFGQSPEFLAERGVERMTVDSQPGYPCRVSLSDVNIGETVLLLNYEHFSAQSPYRSSHAIFVKEGASRASTGRNEIPETLRIRLLSVRAFDARDMMVDADVVGGQDLAPIIETMLSIESVAFLHIHNAKRGCFMARVDRA
jgi:hypothetical protein